MRGLKRVSARRSDALTDVGWEQLEVLFATHYRAHGWAVEHCGTGGTGARFDGGIDLKLRRVDAYLLVQVKHWNALKVPHNDVHQLLGLMVNESATGAVLITSGEFTRAAVEAAARHGHVQLVDGTELRAMLGDVQLPTTADVGSALVDELVRTMSSSATTNKPRSVHSRGRARGPLFGGLARRRAGRCCDLCHAGLGVVGADRRDGWYFAAVGFGCVGGRRGPGCVALTRATC